MASVHDNFSADEHIGLNISAAMDAVGMSPDDLADALDVSLSDVRGWIAGYERACVDAVCAIAGVLGVPVWSLFTYGGNVVPRQ